MSSPGAGWGVGVVNQETSVRKGRSEGPLSAETG